MTHLLRPLAVALICLLAIQFLLGMVTNFYGRIPETRRDCPETSTPASAAARWALLHGPPVLKLHVAVGLAIGACAIALAVLALRSRERSWRLSALLGLFTAAPAGLAGAAFLAYRQDDLYSLLMSIGFLGALFSYWTGAARTARHGRALLRLSGQETGLGRPGALPASTGRG